MFKKRSESTGGGNFLKFESGQEMTGVFRGEPLEFYQAWPKGGDKKVALEPFPGAKLRFKCNFVVHEGGKFTAKVFEFGVRLNNQLADIAEEYDLSKTKIKIKRQGSGKETSWSIMPIAREPLSAKQLKEIEAVELNVLDDTQAPAAEVSESTDPETW